MNKTIKRDYGLPKIAVDTKELASMLSCGEATAKKCGIECGARVQIGKRVLWNVKVVQEYLDSLAG